MITTQRSGLSGYCFMGGNLSKYKTAVIVVRDNNGKERGLYSNEA